MQLSPPGRVYSASELSTRDSKMEVGIFPTPADSLENHPLRSGRVGFEVDLIAQLLETPRETLDTLALL